MEFFFFVLFLVNVIDGVLIVLMVLIEVFYLVRFLFESVVIFGLFLLMMNDLLFFLFRVVVGKVLLELLGFVSVVLFSICLSVLLFFLGIMFFLRICLFLSLDFMSLSGMVWWRLLLFVFGWCFLKRFLVLGMLLIVGVLGFLGIVIVCVMVLVGFDEFCVCFFVEVVMLLRCSVLELVLIDVFLLSLMEVVMSVLMVSLWWVLGMVVLVVVVVLLRSFFGMRLWLSINFFEMLFEFVWFCC